MRLPPSFSHPCLLFAAVVFSAFLFVSVTRANTITTAHLQAVVETSGAYRIVANVPHWTLEGKLPAEANDIKTDTGTDRLGKYQELTFAWKEGERDLTGFVRLYDRGDLVLFSDMVPQASATPAASFPDFTSVPPEWFHFSYRDSAFSAPQFHLGTTSSPWLFFNAQAQAMLISAASHFPVATLTGNGKDRVASSFSPTLANLPAGWTQQTLLAFGDGINATFDLWGHALTDLQGKKRPSNDADDSLKYYGYWTDNGADYYYNYDQDKGYAGTLQQLTDTYRQEKIPLRYLQLDSWWYHKSYTYFDGKEGKTKNPKLPTGDWNCYGGLLDYTASAFLFPEGLSRFQHEIGLPLITHNRWIDPASPYHQQYKISGIAAVDPAFWKHTAAYLKESGIVTYEQDWLSAIYDHSPELSSTPDLGEAMLDGMAQACAEQGITVQYCMALPRCFLQASKYDNVTTIRTSDDRFNPEKYHNFLYTSRFASALGMWPWADVFMSRETNNLLLSNLSAGPVGTGDALGKEDKANILKTVRSDGVIIKPDAALVPVDAAYVAEAQKQMVPLIATTYTDHSGQRTSYTVVLDPPKMVGLPFTLAPSDLNVSGPVYVYDYFNATGRWLEKNQPYSGKVGEGGLTYLIGAPVGPSGIAFLGDRDKFASLGRQRIASLEDQPDHLKAEVLLTPSEDVVNLHGYAHKIPTVDVQNGTADPVAYDETTGHFTVAVRAVASAPLEAGTDPIRRVEVTFRPGLGD